MAEEPEPAANGEPGPRWVVWQGREQVCADSVGVRDPPGGEAEREGGPRPGELHQHGTGP